jgi:hypothetical protein
MNMNQFGKRSLEERRCIHSSLWFQLHHDLFLSFLWPKQTRRFDGTNSISWNECETRGNPFPVIPLALSQWRRSKGTRMNFMCRSFWCFIRCRISIHLSLFEKKILRFLLSSHPNNLRVIGYLSFQEIPCFEMYLATISHKSHRYVRTLSWVLTIWAKQLRYFLLFTSTHESHTDHSFDDIH